jgi:transcriptional antiterminator RfaH
MPILHAEPELFPPHLLADEVSPPECEGRVWWALHTRPRQEKSLARELYRREVPFYLPLMPQRTRIERRNLTSHLPLFPGYVFLLADGEERVAALSTSRVVRALQVPDQEGLRRDLLQVHRLIATRTTITLEGSLVAGDKVEITSGPLFGMKGKIVRGASGRRFVVEVDFIQQGASVLMDESTLTRAE